MLAPPSSTSTPISKKTRRESNPTPPQNTDSKKLRLDLSSNSSSTMGEESILSKTDLDNIASVVQAQLLPQIDKLVSAAVQAATAPLLKEVDDLKSQNRILNAKIDSLEQYGRRPLMRLSGLPECVNPNDEETVSRVSHVLTQIDKEFNEGEIERAHRIGEPPSDPSKKYNRQIIIRLKSPSIKHRILRSSKNLANISDLQDLRLNEDLTSTRGKLAYIARLLVKDNKLSQTWTSDGNIFVKDTSNKLHKCYNEIEFYETLSSLHIAVPVIPDKPKKQNRK